MSTTIEISESDLDKRRKALPKRFRPLTKAYIGGVSDCFGLATRAIGICGGQKGALRYNQWRIGLVPRKASLGYFEIWQAKSGLGFFLKKINLNLYLLKNIKEEELILVHCSPEHLTDVKLERYKTPPHLHFAISEDPWPKVHIPLCDGFQKNVLSSLEELDHAFYRIIDFVSDQVFPFLNL
jgi:hypothetical protein